MAERRFFNDRERAALYLAADGRCTDCQGELQPGWHADHVDPYSGGGQTDVINGQALCPQCNLKKGIALTTLRAWQQQALDVLAANPKSDYLFVATPGAGKTTFALEAAKRMLADGTVGRVAVIVPSDSLRLQWADAAGHAGLDLMPASSPEHYTKPGYSGCVATYAQLAAGAGRDLLRRSTQVPTLAILDEIHHAGDRQAWGMALQSAVENAAVRLALTGTPWRRDPQSPIPFVSYDANGKLIVDYAYEYGTAVAEGVCRSVEFYAWDGEAKWIDHSKPEGLRNNWARLGVDLAAADVSTVLDGVYDPAHQWMPVVLAEAHKALTEMRAEVPDAAGLVVAERKSHARAYGELLRQITGSDPVIVVSDEGDNAARQAKDAIERFRTGTSPWIIAVKMVSEGVDIPRLAVGVYAAKAKTPLFFRQVVGRLVRVRPDEELNARLFIPAVPVFVDHALDIETELRHQLEAEAQAVDEPGEGSGGAGEQLEFPMRTIIAAGDAEFHRAIYSGEEASPVECAEAEATARRLGIPLKYALNLLPLIRARSVQAADGVDLPQPTVAGVTPTPRHRQEKLLRQEIDRLAGRYSYRAGIDKKEVNYRIRAAGFPARSQCSIEQLEQLHEYLVRELEGLT